MNFILVCSIIWFLWLLACVMCIHYTSSVYPKLFGIFEHLCAPVYKTAAIKFSRWLKFCRFYDKNKKNYSTVVCGWWNECVWLSSSRASSKGHFTFCFQQIQTYENHTNSISNNIASNKKRENNDAKKELPSSLSQLFQAIFAVSLFFLFIPVNNSGIRFLYSYIRWT